MDNFIPFSEGEYFTLFTTLSHPFSRGSSHISSPTPSTASTIDPRYLSHPMDLPLLARQVQFFKHIISTPPFSTYFKSSGRLIPSNSFSSSSSKEWTLPEAEEVVRKQLVSNYYPVGTCAIGKVVDERLRVKGVRGLRVVDGCVFPGLPRGNIISAVWAVAERGADFVVEEWGLGGV